VAEVLQAAQNNNSLGAGLKVWDVDKALSDFMIFTAQCTLVQSAVLQSHVIRPSVCLSIHL